MSAGKEYLLMHFFKALCASEFMFAVQLKFCAQAAVAPVLFAVRLHLKLMYLSSYLATENPFGHTAMWPNCNFLYLLCQFRKLI